MCLYLNKFSKSNIATTDIECYKLLIDTLPLDANILSKYKDEKVIVCINNEHYNATVKCAPFVYFHISDTSIVRDIIIEEVDFVIIQSTTECFSNRRNAFLTPFMRSIVKIGNEYDSKLIRTKHDIIEIGLHSFSDLCYIESAKCVAKCVIPRGAEYYSGRFSIEGDSYASNRIKYIKIL